MRLTAESEASHSGGCSQTGGHADSNPRHGTCCSILNYAAAGGGGSDLPDCWIPLYDRGNTTMIANDPLDLSRTGATTQVRASGQGLANKGFAFLGPVRFPFKASGEQCMLTLGGFELDVAYK